MRKTVKIMPGVQMTMSRSGVSYSAGTKYARVTRTAQSRVTGTAHIPGSGISYSHTAGKTRTPASSAYTGFKSAQATPAPASPIRRPRPERRPISSEPIRAAHVRVETSTRRIQAAGSVRPSGKLVVLGVVAAVGFVLSMLVLPLLLLELPLLVWLIVALVKHLIVLRRVAAPENAN